LAWVSGGVVFSWVPFKGWVKAEDSVRRPAVQLPAGWASKVADHLERARVDGVQFVASADTPYGPALRLRHARGETWLSADGGKLLEPDAAAIGRFAQRMYVGSGRLATVVRLEDVPVRALIVRETGGRRDVWLASFDDGLQTRLYFDGRSGELLAIRNNAWVLHDFFWRLHLMDYSAGEDFSHPLIKGASLAALALVLTGLVLAALALRRAHRQRLRRRASALSTPSVRSR
jgi:hypothetical protein